MCCGPWGHKELDMTECLNKMSLQNFLCSMETVVFIFFTVKLYSNFECNTVFFF